MLLNKITSFNGEYRFLSNFYPAPLEFGGIMFPTSEHAYQASKSVDVDLWIEFSKISTPGKAKRVGQLIQKRPNWNIVRYKMMQNIIHQKFKYNPDLKERLLSTSPAILEEGNTWGDVYWGVCNGVGDNNLGKILMEYRDNPLNFL